MYISQLISWFTLYTLLSFNTQSQKQWKENSFLAFHVQFTRVLTKKMDYIRHAVLIFMLTIVSKASSSLNIDMCSEQTVKVDDGHHGYLTYNRSMVNSSSLSGVCQCIITKNSYYKPDVDIWIQDSRICGTTCCMEQLYIHASDEKIYDSCVDDEPGNGRCLFPRTRSLLNVGSIYKNQQVKIMFYFSGEVIQTTDSFILDIEVENVRVLSEQIQIACTKPEFGDSLPSTCSTTYKTTPATTLSETQDAGLIVGVSIGCLCVIAGIIAVAVFITRRNKSASETKMPKESTLPKIRKKYDQFSTELVDNTMCSSTTTPGMPSPDMPSSDMYIMDNPQYSSRQTPDNQLSADMYIMDNPQYSSMPTHPGPEFIEDTVYMEADMDHVDTIYMGADMDHVDTTYMQADMDHIAHPMDNSQQPDNDEYSEVDDVNHGCSMGSAERNIRDSAYAGGTQLFENAIYDNQPFDVGRMSDVVYSGDTELVDNAVYG